MTEEKNFTVRVSKEGRITIPKGVRDALNIRENDLIDCVIKKIKPTRNEK